MYILIIYIHILCLCSLALKCTCQEDGMPGAEQAETGDPRQEAGAPLGGIEANRFGFTGILMGFSGISGDLPSGKHTKNYGKSPFFMGKFTISMAIFNSYLYVYQRVINVVFTCFTPG